MKKTMFVTPYYTPNIVGGAEISTQLVAECFPDDTMILTVDLHEEISQINDVEVIKVYDSFLSDCWKKVLCNEKPTIKDKILLNCKSNFVVPKLKNKYIDIIRRQKIEAIVCNSNAEVLGRASLWRAAYDCGVPLYVALRDPLLLEKRVAGINVSAVLRKVVKSQMKYVTGFVAPSQFMLDLYSQYGIRSEKTTVIPNAVDTEFLVPYFEESNWNIVYAGSLVAKKGILTLINAVKLLRDTFPQVRLIIYGRGELEQICSQYDFVECHPWAQREELYKVFRESRAVVLPSEWQEAFGRIVVEAAAQGTIAIGSKIGGIPEIFDNNQNYLFESGNCVELCEKLHRIMCLSKQEYCSEVEMLQNKFDKYTINRYKMLWGEYLNGM